MQKIYWKFVKCPGNLDFCYTGFVDTLKRDICSNSLQQQCWQCRPIIDRFTKQSKFYGDGCTWYIHMVISFLRKLQAGYFVGQTMQNNCVRRSVISKRLLLQHMYTILYLSIVLARPNTEVYSFSLYLPPHVHIVLILVKNQLLLQPQTY